MKIIVGPPGCWAREAGELLDGNVIDIEKLLEERHGAPFSDLVLFGVDEDEIRSSVLECLDSAPDYLILGSGMLGKRQADPIIADAIDAAIDDGAVKVFLDAEPKVLMHRCGMDVARPASLGAPRAMYVSMLKERTPMYAHRAHRIDTSDLSAAQIAEALAMLTPEDLGPSSTNPVV